MPDAELIALVKPQFELGLAEPPRARALLDAAVTRACAGFEARGWQIADSMPSPVRGTRGSVEHLLLARRVETGHETPDTCPAARDSRDRAPLGEQR
jgi:23S rRNA (cytidine1920-2'-O)/16S rRNA (cytidine1409-2'-O)-methyltransferase